MASQSHTISPARATRVRVGTKAPDIQLVDPITGKEVHLAELLGRNVLLLFLRGTWCPFCRKQIELLSQNYATLKAANISVIGVICQSAGGVRQYLEAHPLPFPLLPDESRKVSKAYGTHYWFTFEGINLSNPALFILDSQGIVTFAHVGRNMSDLPVATVLEKFLTLLNTPEASPAEEATSA